MAASHSGVPKVRLLTVLRASASWLVLDI
jgi:hypothetical protein